MERLEKRSSVFICMVGNDAHLIKQCHIKAQTPIKSQGMCLPGKKHLDNA